MHLRQVRVLLMTRQLSPSQAQAITTKSAHHPSATQKRDAENFDRVCSEGKKLKPPSKVKR